MEIKLTIPEEAHEEFAELLALRDEIYDKIERALTDATPMLYQRDLVSFVVERTGDDRDTIQDIVWLLLTLYSVRADTGLDTAEFAESVCQALKTEGDNRLKPPGNDWATFKKRLIRLLSFDQSLGITSKALDVKREHEHLYCRDGTRLVTDIRPVFTDDLSIAPTAAMIVHTLKIAYHEASELKELYIALDSKDVKHLRGILDRAEQKAQSLQLVLRAANVQRLDREID